MKCSPPNQSQTFFTFTKMIFTGGGVYMGPLNPNEHSNILNIFKRTLVHALLADCTGGSRHSHWRGPAAPSSKNAEFISELGGSGGMPPRKIFLNSMMQNAANWTIFFFFFIFVRPCAYGRLHIDLLPLVWFLADVSILDVNYLVPQVHFFADHAIFD